MTDESIAPENGGTPATTDHTRARQPEVVDDEDVRLMDSDDEREEVERDKQFKKRLEDMDRHICLHQSWRSDLRRRLSKAEQKWKDLHERRKLRDLMDNALDDFNAEQLNNDSQLKVDDNETT